MSLFARHWARIAVTLIPLVFALLHASGALRIGVLTLTTLFMMRGFGPPCLKRSTSAS